MIYTITFSPSIDYVINSDEKFKSNDLNRVFDYEILPGGKGINASIVLKRIGFDNKAITFLGGSTKSLFLNLVEKEKIDLISFDSQNDTRINVKMFAQDTSFEINGSRAIILDNEFKKIIDLISTLNSNDFVFLMGICPDDQLKTIVEKLAEKNINFALDVDSKMILNLLKYKPFIIKPNKSELETLVDKKINTEKELLDSMQWLKNQGLQNLLISDGGKGSYFLDQDNNFYKVTLNKKFDIVSTVGAGDTLISTFTCIYKESNDVIKSLKEATSMSIGTSCTRFLADIQDKDKYHEFIDIEKINN